VNPAIENKQKFAKAKREKIRAQTTEVGSKKKYAA
jgi:hypothetical protein